MVDEESSPEPGVSWRSVRAVLPRWGDLLGPVAVVIMPAALVVSVAHGIVLGDRSVVVNGVLQAVGSSSGQGIWAIAALVLLGPGLLVAQAAGLFVTAGHLLQQPVRVRDALRAALRRLPALIVAGLMVSVTVAAVTVGALAWWVLADGPGPLVVTVAAVVGFCVLPHLLLFFPAVVLEKLNPLRALPVARRRFLGWGFRTRLTLILLLGLAAAVTIGLDAALGPVEQSLELAPRALAGPVAAALLVPAWSTALAILYLRRPPSRRFADGIDSPGSDRERVRQVLADISGRRSYPTLRARLVPLVLLSLFVPNLAVTGLSRLNPFDAPAMSEHVVDAGLDGRLRINSSGEAGLIPTGADRVTIFNRPYDWDSFSLTDCADARCTRSVSALHEFAKPGTDEYPPGFVSLGDGTFAAAAWTIEGESSATGSRPTWGLRIHRCEGSGCDRTGGRTLARSVHRYVWARAAQTSDGRLVIAHVDGRQGDIRLRLTSCADSSCARSHTADLGVDARQALGSGALVLTSDDRPVIVAEDGDDRLTVISCDTLTCEDRVTAQPLPRRNESIKDLEAVVGPDGRAAILYRWFDDDIEYHTRFVRCSTPACDRATEVDIPGFAGHPVLALDSTGRPLITGTRYARGNPFDQPEYGLLLSCRDLTCRQRDEVRLGAIELGFGAKDMVVGPDDRPRILWAGARSSDDKARMRVLTCEQPRCGAGRGRVTGG